LKNNFFYQKQIVVFGSVWKRLMPLHLSQWLLHSVPSLCKCFVEAAADQQPLDIVEVIMWKADSLLRTTLCNYFKWNGAVSLCARSHLRKVTMSYKQNFRTIVAKHWLFQNNVNLHSVQGSISKVRWAENRRVCRLTSLLAKNVPPPTQAAQSMSRPPQQQQQQLWRWRKRSEALERNSRDLSGEEQFSLLRLCCDVTISTSPSFGMGQTRPLWVGGWRIVVAAGCCWTPDRTNWHVASGRCFHCYHIQREVSFVLIARKQCCRATNFINAYCRRHGVWLV